MNNTHTIYTPIAEAMIDARYKCYKECMDKALNLEGHFPSWSVLNDFHDTTKKQVDKITSSGVQRKDWNANLSFKTYKRLVKDGIMPAPEQVTKTAMECRRNWVTHHA